MKKLLVAAVLLLGGTFVGCKKESIEEEEKNKATIDNIEIGLNNNEIGVIDKDFHFNANIVAATRIESISISITQKADESYSKPWSFEKTWTQFEGIKNALVHEHFSIPSDAAEGKYDFLITVKDQNGTTLEERRVITLYLAANLPVDPQLFSFYVGVVDDEYKILKEVYSSFTPENADFKLKKDDLLTIRAAVSGLKGDGKAVMLLINKKHQHRPETLEAIDYSKAVVVDIAEHIGVPASGSFSTTTDRSTTPVTLRKPVLKIGALTDNNIPQNSINGLKNWESGRYYLALIYNNTTYNMGLYNYIELDIDMN